MNSEFLLEFSQALKKCTEIVINIKKQDDERDRWRSYYFYEDDLEHDYGYESSYHNLYDTHQFPHPRNKDFPTIPSEPVSKHQTHPKPRVNDPGNPIRYPTQITRAVRKKAKQSPFDFSKIPGAPHPMPNGYTRRFPQFNGNKDVSIESHLDTL